MNEEQQQRILSEMIAGFSEQVKKSADEAISEAECKILPYVLQDTEMNAMIQAQEIVEMILAGKFDHDGEWIKMHHPRHISSIRMKFSEMKYDTLRDRIIERMTTCPKDAKIAALELELKLAYESRRF